MSNLKEYRESYYQFTGKVSDNTRTLALSAVAAIWLFKADTKDGYILLDINLYWSLLWIFSSLLCDFLQYLYASVAWGAYTRKKELAGTLPEEDLIAPRCINWPTNILFYGKVLFLIFAYTLLVYFFLGKVLH